MSYSCLDVQSHIVLIIKHEIIEVASTGENIHYYRIYMCQFTVKEPSRTLEGALVC